MISHSKQTTTEVWPHPNPGPQTCPPIIILTSSLSCFQWTLWEFPLKEDCMFSLLMQACVNYGEREQVGSMWENLKHGTKQSQLLWKWTHLAINGKVSSKMKTVQSFTHPHVVLTSVVSLFCEKWKFMLSHVRAAFFPIQVDGDLYIQMMKRKNTPKCSLY